MAAIGSASDRRRPPAAAAVDTKAVNSCCDPDDYQRMFGDRFSRQTAKRYRRKGLTKPAARLLNAVSERGVEGMTVLEVGGGVGQLQIELLQQGAAASTNLELVDSYDAEARALATTAGVADRMSRQRINLAEEPEAVPPHDIVILHRVVCCYPDYDRLLSAAAGRARRLLVFSHPPRNWRTRSVTTFENLWFRMRGNSFRTFVHDPTAMIESASVGSLRLAETQPGRRWSIVAMQATT